MKDKVIIITGGSSGIGKALAEKFGREGSKLVITGRRKEQLEDAASDLRQLGIEVTPVVADASLEDDCDHVIDVAIREYGQIDVLINNAGISMRALFEDLQLEVFKKVMDVNFYGLVNTTKYALPHILRSKGSIVGISSVNGRRATPARSAYSASKFAMIGFLESLRSEMLDRGVHVLTACPGFTSSNIRRAALMANGKTYGGPARDESYMMSAEEVADHVYTAVVRRKRDILLTLQGKLAVWLNYFFPKWMDRKALELIRREQHGEQEEDAKRIGERVRT
ncbi:MAG TPA: SDR family oxidoreductase [Cyclobacteriaceae bacterium]